MRRKGYILIIMLFLAFGTVVAQQAKNDSILSFTLKTAQEYALKNSPVIKNANLDLESAKKKIWETTAIGLPQVNSKLSYSYQITVPSTIEKFTSSMIPGFSTFPKDVQNNVIDSIMKDTRWGLTYDITVTELLFSGAYIVGLQTSRVYKQLSELAISKSENDAVEQVNNAYFLVLIAQENKNIIDSMYLNTEKIYSYIKSMNEQGLLEETDVDQIQLTLSTIKNSRELILRQLEVAKNLLKFQMGIEINQPISLLDNLNSLILSSDFISLTAKDFNVQNHVDYKLMETMEKMSGLNVKLQKSALLPDVVAFYNHQENFNDHSFSFTPPDMVGVSVNIPIFGSGSKLSKISQAKIGLEKSTNSKLQAKLGLETAFSDAKSAFISALNSYQTSKESLLLAEKIYNKSLIKYKEGIIGSMELTQIQNQYLLAQTNYYTSIITLTSAKSKLEKLLK